MTRAKRLPPEIRKQSILTAAATLSAKIGYNRVTRDEIAVVAEITSSLVSVHFPRMKDLRDAIIEEAIKKEYVEILAQAFALKDPRIEKVPPELKRKINRYISLL